VKIINYIVYDLEFNQKSLNSSNNKDILKLPFEIIQIGALKFDENFDIIDNFNRLIKPTVHNTVHPYVESLTNITTDRLALCETFPKVYHDFIEFISDSEIILCVWGKTDIKELIRNAKFHNLPISSIPKRYIDVQMYSSSYFKIPKGSKIGLKTSVELLNIKFEDNFHDAYYDAYYTLEVYKSIYKYSTPPKICNFTSERRNITSNSQVDNKALIEQFEKMYNRKMSDEEKAIIKLAYIMGKTNQFTT
jgi:inhibitor of KinA sporulation pathway (predicted exonuclease)